MTGSGKTGLCVSLLEEAALDGVPVIAIDPKGDITNLMLTFPELAPADFRPWIDEAAATRKGLSPDEFAKATAETWRSGLAKWGQDGARIGRLRDAVDMAIYTPGSSAGLPLAVLRSFAAPPASFRGDADAMRERVSSAVSGLLALVGIDADPIQSREHIMLSQLVDRAWRDGDDLDLGGMIGQVQSPPFDRIGVMDVDTFFPEKDRFNLSMRLNSLLASPGFAAWMEGEALEVPRLLWTETGKPRISIISIAHLQDAERMFFVTLLLNEVVGWMRTQAGTSSLRAILYMDEVFGFLPPTANPPSKLPLLTLLKQARAFGLGVLLATQNPVDLDYKALSNAGTWFLGRLQTERDKLRVLDGLEGAFTASGHVFDRKRLEAQLSGLRSRVFLMNNVHENEPVLFHTRWAMSYLRGPLTRAQIEVLMAHRKTVPVLEAEAKSKPKAVATERGDRSRPDSPKEIPVRFIGLDGAGEGLVVYVPGIIGTADLHYVKAPVHVDLWKTATFLTRLEGSATGQVWEKAQPVERDAVVDQPLPDARYATLPQKAGGAKAFTTWEGQFKTFLYQQQSLILYKCSKLKLTSTPAETEAEFGIRVREAVREKRDAEVEKLKQQYEAKFSRLNDQIQRANEKVAREEAQLGQQKLQTAVSVGSTVLGALLGRKVGSRANVGRATTALRGAGRVAREKQDIELAQVRVKDLEEDLADLERRFEDDLSGVEDALKPKNFTISEEHVRPRKSDINVDLLALAWIPVSGELAE
jgi:hypothetical protein